MTWQTMQAAGAVCLPAAGRREGSGVLDVGGSGYYWSSTALGSDSAHSVLFFSRVYPGHNGRRYNGFSVRLITESN